VCREGDELLSCAYASYKLSATEVQIDNLAVTASAYLRGIGSALLHRALRWALDKRAAPKVALVITNDNVSAQTLYTGAGFALIADGLHFRLETQLSRIA
jgi:GNAT superfamily N-acetyltransferase